MKTTHKNGETLTGIQETSSATPLAMSHCRVTDYISKDPGILGGLKDHITTLFKASSLGITLGKVNFLLFFLIQDMSKDFLPKRKTSPHSLLMQLKHSKPSRASAHNKL